MSLIGRVLRSRCRRWILCLMSGRRACLSRCQNTIGGIGIVVSSAGCYIFNLSGLVLITIVDTPEKYKDAPVCLQVMGRRFEEEKVLGLLQTVNRALGRDELYMA